MAEQGGIVAPTGPAGSVLLFHCNLVHASPPNISPWGRTIVYLSLCHVDNHIRRFQRPEWVAHRDFTPIRPLARSEEHTSELQSLMRISYAVFCLKQKKEHQTRS